MPRDWTLDRHVVTDAEVFEELPYKSRCCFVRPSRAPGSEAAIPSERVRIVTDTGAFELLMQTPFERIIGLKRLQPVFHADRFVVDECIP
jgi:hypothetical protein